MSKIVDDITYIFKNKRNKKIVIQIAPAVRVSIGEYLDYEAGTNVIGELIGAFKELGADYVFDTNLGADLTVIEEANELVNRLKTNTLLPMFTTCCPSWYMFAERLYPELIPYLSTIKSPQAILASVVKTYFAGKIQVQPSDIIHIVIAPCAMKKEEAKRQELWVNPGIPNIDYVLTTTETVELFKLNKIDFKNVDKSEFDNPLGLASGAGSIFGTTGGVMEATIRTAYFLLTGKDLVDFELEEIRNTGLKREGMIEFAGYKINIATVNSLAEMKPILEELKTTGKSRYQFIEVMNCPMGCVGGVGQWTKDPEVLMKRRNALFAYDKQHKYRAAHLNDAVKEIYNNFFGHIGSEKASQIMHTHYQDRTKEAAEHFSCKIEDNK
jgi:iron-only hydrogenase group A